MKCTFKVKTKQIESSSIEGFIEKLQKEEQPVSKIIAVLVYYEKTD